MNQRKISYLTQLSNNIYSDLREIDIALDNDNSNTEKILIRQAEDIIKQCKKIKEKCEGESEDE